MFQIKVISIVYVKRNRFFFFKFVLINLAQPVRKYRYNITIVFCSIVHLKTSDFL